MCGNFWVSRENEKGIGLVYAGKSRQGQGPGYWRDWNQRHPAPSCKQDREQGPASSGNFPPGPGEFGVDQDGVAGDGGVVKSCKQMLGVSNPPARSVASHCVFKVEVESECRGCFVSSFERATERDSTKQKIARAFVRASFWWFSPTIVPGLSLYPVMVYQTADW